MITKFGKEKRNIKCLLNIRVNYFSNLKIHFVTMIECLCIIAISFVLKTFNILKNCKGY